MKMIPFSSLFEREVDSINDVRIFSNNTLSDMTYGWRDESLSTSQRKKEIDKMNEYSFKILTNLFKIYYPMKGWEAEQYIKKTITDIYDNWFSKMTATMIKSKLNTHVFYADINQRYLSKLHDELVRSHGYGKSINVSEDKVIPLWNYFLNEWSNLIISCTYLKHSPTKDDYYNILEIVRTKIPYVKINKIPK